MPVVDGSYLSVAVPAQRHARDDGTASFAACCPAASAPPPIWVSPPEDRLFEQTDLRVEDSDFVAPAVVTGEDSAGECGWTANWPCPDQPLAGPTSFVVEYWGGKDSLPGTAWESVAVPGQGGRTVHYAFVFGYKRLRIDVPAQKHATNETNLESFVQLFFFFTPGATSAATPPRRRRHADRPQPPGGR